MSNEDVRRLRFLRAGAIFLSLTIPAACQSPVALGPAPSATHASSPGTASLPVTAPAPSTAATIDPVKVNQVLGPAVGEVIGRTARGGQLGSGFVISHDSSASYMVTNNHVVTGVTSLAVLMPDGRHFPVTVRGADPLEDIAVVKIPDPTLPLAVFADSRQVKVGQPVVAIGNPEGNQGSVTLGIVSAVHRTLTNVGGSGNTPGESLPDVIQTDAAINPGNSGGPLADADGHVIGVNTAGETSAQSIGFAIPSLVAKRIAEALIAGRTPGHPYVGVCYQTIADALTADPNSKISGFGIVVSKALSATPADKAGIKGGDVVQTVDGVDLNNGNTLGGVLQTHNPGDSVPFVINRGGSTVNTTVTLGERPTSPASC